jgi:uncharacterized membrane protein
MATETGNGWDEHVRSVTVTTLAAVFGIVAAIASSILTADMVAAGNLAEASRSQEPQLVVLVAILVQLPIVRFVGFYDDEEWSTKTMLFIAFMTFSFWFVTWGILLATRATF